MQRNNSYPNNLERILGIIFLSSLLVTGISLLTDMKQSKLSARTYGALLLTATSAYGAFRRENQRITLVSNNEGSWYAL